MIHHWLLWMYTDLVLFRVESNSYSSLSLLVFITSILTNIKFKSVTILSK